MTISTTLQITDGTTTIDLSGTNSTGTGAFIKYVPTWGDKGAEFVKETALIRFHDTSLANVLSTIDSLQRLLIQSARWYFSKSGAAIYLKYRADSTGDVIKLRRALIIGGKLEYDEEALGYQVRNNLFKARIEWTRTEFEADTEVQIGLMNGSTAKTTNAITIFNHDDGTAAAYHDNWVEIASADVAGVDDAAIRFELVDSTISGNLKTIYAALGAFQDFANFPNILEGEAATLSGGSVIDEATCSGTGGAAGIGQYASITGIGATDTIAARWALTTDQATACAGQRYHIIARFFELPAANMFATMAVTPINGTSYAEVSQTVALSTTEYLQDLGTVRIPGGLAMTAALKACDLVMLVRKTGGSGALKLDYIALMPTDGYRVYTAWDNGLANTDTLVDDGSSIHQVYSIVSTKKDTNFHATGDEIKLVPARTQRMYFLFEKSDLTAPILATATLKVYARQRYKTL